MASDFKDTQQFPLYRTKKQRPVFSAESEVWMNYGFLTVMCQTQTLDGQSRALKMRTFA